MAFLILILISFFCRTVYSQVDGQIRLIDDTGSWYRGRLEIYYRGRWGTICSRMFSDTDAKVACKQLGVDPRYVDNAQAIINVDYFGLGTLGPIIDDIRCNGTERRLIDCMLNICSHTRCDRTIAVGVICNIPPPIASTPWHPFPISTTTPRHTNPSTLGNFFYSRGKCVNTQNLVRIVRAEKVCPDSGVVQVFVNHQWVGVCDDFWERVDARVICRMMCFEPSQSLAGSEDFDTTGIPEEMMMTNVNCTGNENDIWSCRYSLQRNSCGRNEMAKITCAELVRTPTIEPPQLVCEDNTIMANFSTEWKGWFHSNQMSLVWPFTGPCMSRRQDYGSYITFSIPFDQCGTVRTWNTTHIIYKNAILYVPTPTTIISRFKTYLIYVQCEMNRLYYVEKQVIPATVSAIASGKGNYTVLMHFYIDNFITMYTQYPVRIPVGNYLHVSIQLITYEVNLILIVTSCYATPSANRFDSHRWTLFADKCKIDNTTCYYPLDEYNFGFSYQTFKFVHYNEVHLHCEAYVCPREDRSQDCDRSCFQNTQGQIGKRKRRQADRQIIYVKSDVIMMYDPADEQGGLTHFGPTQPSYPNKFTTPTPAASQPETTTDRFSDNIIVVSNEGSKTENKDTEKNKHVNNPDQPTSTNSTVKTTVVFTTQRAIEAEKENGNVPDKTNESLTSNNEGQVGQVHDVTEPVKEPIHVTPNVIVTEKAVQETDESLTSNNEGQVGQVHDATETVKEPIHVTPNVIVTEKAVQESDESLTSNNEGQVDQVHDATETVQEPIHVTPNVIETGKAEQESENGKPEITSMKLTDKEVTRAPATPKLTTAKRQDTEKPEKVQEVVQEANATFDRLVLAKSSAISAHVTRCVYLLCLVVSSAALSSV